MCIYIYLSIHILFNVYHVHGLDLPHGPLSIGVMCVKTVASSHCNKTY